MRKRGVLIFAAISVVLTADTASEKTRARAWDALRSNVKDKGVLNHSLGVEAMMREMARTKPENDAVEWALAGLLHDIDIATTENNLSVHGVAGARMLRDLGFREAVAYAVSAHDDHTGIARKSRMDHALYCADQVYWKIMGTSQLPLRRDQERGAGLRMATGSGGAVSKPSCETVGRVCGGRLDDDAGIRSGNRRVAESHVESRRQTWQVNREFLLAMVNKSRRCWWSEEFRLDWHRLGRGP
jgi:putative nucleotidyltransferase with HDIG domain